MEQLEQIVYFSRASKPIDEQFLANILSDSRERNRSGQVSGLLLYGGNHFLQLIEGPLDSIDETWSRISRDPRHVVGSLLGRRTVPGRLCGQWSMDVYQSGDLDALVSSQDAQDAKSSLIGIPTLAERLLVAAIWAKSPA